MGGRYGGVVSFEVPSREAALSFLERLRIFTLAESLGAVESLVEHPARMTHASVADSPLSVDPALLRLSVGLESLDDLIRDLDQALS
jgi:cystathionine gamma-synthase